MTGPSFNLPNAPIVEAVLDIDCDFSPDFDIKRVEQPSQQRLAECYPTMRAQFMQELRFETKPDGGFSHAAESGGVKAYQFFSKDEKQIVQVRGAGYSFNRLAPYIGFDEYLPEIRRTWQLYREIASPILIRTVRLRYINRIHLPLADGRVALEEYFRIGPRLPDEDRLTFVSFFNQYVAVESETGNQVTAILTAQRPVEDKVPIIFDNAAAAVGTADPANWDVLEQTLRSLRDLKNRVFKNTLTDKCLSLFQ